MSAPKVYLGCSCPKCSGLIEYPDYTAGGVMNCPQCGNQVRLPAAPAAASPPPAPQMPAQKPPAIPPPKIRTAPPQPKAPTAVSPKRPLHRTTRTTITVLASAMAVLFLLMVARGLAKYLKNARSPESPGQEAEPTGNSSKTAPVPSKSNPPSSPATPPGPAAKPKALKSIGDLKVSETVSVEEPKGAKGSRLVYATGTVKNESDLQRYGVRVGLDLFDAAGAKVGTATDYTASIEPRATWRFRALVVERRAASAKFSKITEDN